MQYAPTEGAPRAGGGRQHFEAPSLSWRRGAPQARHYRGGEVEATVVYVTEGLRKFGLPVTERGDKQPYHPTDRPFLPGRATRL